MKVIRGLFFDLDGTLVDSFEALFAAYEQAVKSTGRTLGKDMFREFFGQRADLSLPRMFPGISEADMKQIVDEKARVYKDHFTLLRPHRQLIDFIETIRLHHTTVLVTMAKAVAANDVIDAIGIRHLFDHIITGNDVEHPKPHPESYLKALALTGLEPAEVLAFEDSASGLTAANAAGIAALTITIPEVS